MRKRYIVAQNMMIKAAKNKERRASKGPEDVRRE
jgi:hypothetical protein